MLEAKWMHMRVSRVGETKGLAPGARGARDDTGLGQTTKAAWAAAGRCPVTPDHGKPLWVTGVEGGRWDRVEVAQSGCWGAGRRWLRVFRQGVPEPGGGREKIFLW